MDKKNKPRDEEHNKSEKRHEFEQNINMEVVKNRDFLKKLQANPHKALEEKFGVEIPLHIKIHVHVEEPNSWHLVIKGAVHSSDRLSDSELKSLAAGGDCWF
jgi:hypothetical protein